MMVVDLVIADDLAERHGLHTVQPEQPKPGGNHHNDCEYNLAQAATPLSGDRCFTWILPVAERPSSQERAVFLQHEADVSDR